MAQELARLNEELQKEFERESYLKEEQKKTLQRITKMDHKLTQELKDRDLIIANYTKLTAEREKLKKQAKQLFTSQSDPKSKKSKFNPQPVNKHENALFMQSEDAFKELMKSSYVSKNEKKTQHNEEPKKEDEFGLSGIQYDPMFK